MLDADEIRLNALQAGPLIQGWLGRSAEVLAFALAAASIAVLAAAVQSAFADVRVMAVKWDGEAYQLRSSADVQQALQVARADVRAAPALAPQAASGVAQ